MTKKLFSVLLAIVMLLTVAPVAVFAEDDILSYLTYEIYDGEVTIRGCDESISGNVVIPDTIEGCPVTAIDSCAFQYCAFTSVTIPDSITSIIYDSFCDCPNLQYFQVDENNQYYSNDACGVLFNKDKTELITYPAGRSETAYVIPDGVEIISGFSFEDCTVLTDITIPYGVTEIGFAAFRGTSIESISIPDSVIKIETGAFEDTLLESITIPDSVTEIGYGAFYNCTRLKSAILGNGIRLIDNQTFDNCTSLENVVIGENVTTINGPFTNCDSLKSIYIPAKVEEAVGIAGQSGIERILVDKNNAVYANDENGVLMNKNKTTLIEYPYGNKSESYTIPESVTHISFGAFYFLNTLKCLTIPETVSFLDSLSIFYCENLERIIILNPECELSEYSICYVEDEYMPNGKPTIYGYQGSTAEAYATEYSFPFVPLCEHYYVEQVITPATYSHSGMNSTVCEFCGEVLETYEVPMLTIEESEEKSDDKTDVSVIYPDGTFDGEAEIQVTPVSEGDAFKLISHKEGNYKVTMFDISVTVDGEKVQPNGTVLVKMPLPKGYNQNKCVVYYVADDGTMEELTTYHFKDGYVYFETDHFSYYAIVEDVEEPTNRPSWMDNTLNFVQAFIDFFNRIISWFRTLFGIA